jgi:hypothetical protein
MGMVKVYLSVDGILQLHRGWIMQQYYGEKTEKEIAEELARRGLPIT